MVWLRAFHDIYNPTLAPRVVTLLANNFPDIRLGMAGPDKGDGSLQRLHRGLAARFGVGNRITLPGAVPKAEISNWMNR